MINQSQETFQNCSMTLGDVLGRNSIKAATISDLLPVVTRGFGLFQVAIA